MTAEIITFHDDWQKSIATVRATGRVIELWEMAEGKRQATILRCANGTFRWRAYTLVQHRTTRHRQKRRTICDVQISRTLTDAKKAAHALVSRANASRNRDQKRGFSDAENLHPALRNSIEQASPQR